MSVTGLKFSYFVVWTPHGIVVDKIVFDENLWSDWREKLIEYYNNFYLKSVFNEP